MQNGWSKKNEYDLEKFSVQDLMYSIDLLNIDVDKLNNVCNEIRRPSKNMWNFNVETEIEVQWREKKINSKICKIPFACEFEHCLINCWENQSKQNKNANQIVEDRTKWNSTNTDYLYIESAVENAYWIISNSKSMPILWTHFYKSDYMRFRCESNVNTLKRLPFLFCFVQPKRREYFCFKIKSCRELVRSVGTQYAHYSLPISRSQMHRLNLRRPLQNRHYCNQYAYRHLDGVYMCGCVMHIHCVWSRTLKVDIKTMEIKFCLKLYVAWYAVDWCALLWVNASIEIKTFSCAQKPTTYTHKPFVSNINWFSFIMALSLMVCFMLIHSYVIC